MKMLAAILKKITVTILTISNVMQSLTDVLEKQMLRYQNSSWFCDCTSGHKWVTLKVFKKLAMNDTTILNEIISAYKNGSACYFTVNPNASY